MYICFNFQVILDVQNRLSSPKGTTSTPRVKVAEFDEVGGILYLISPLQSLQSRPNVAATCSLALLSCPK
jgi:hypothetical protein